MDNERRAEFGCKAIVVGTPDFGTNGQDADGLVTDATDTVTNILHAVYLGSGAEGVERVREMSHVHFVAEITDPEEF